IELGAGFGYFSVLAAQAGAAQVDAVDLNSVVHLGPRLAKANGCAERVHFHEADLLQFEPETRADVLIGDLRGPTPFSGRGLEIVIDARRRMLTPGGLMIGRRDLLYCAPARRPAGYDERIAAPLSRPGVDLSPVAAVIGATPFPAFVAPEALLADGASWGEIDYLTLESPNHRGGAEWTLTNGADVEGIAIWFEADLGAGQRFSAAPGRPGSAYGQVYLPFKSPVPVEPARVLRLEIAVHLVMGEYVWVWTARVRDPAGHEIRVASQNSIPGRVIDPAAFRKAL
ncbi:MAG: class I SAM-dependent methyltransferase, partial [Vicinamibacterales bacterium]